MRKKGENTGSLNRIKLNNEQIARIVNSYDSYNGNLAKAARNLKHAQSTVRKYWVEAGLRIRARGEYLKENPENTSLKPEQVAGIVAAHKTYEGNVQKASRHTLYAQKTIMKYWDDAGLPRMTRGEIGLSFRKKSK